MGLAPAGSLTPTSRRKKPRKRIHVVYSLVSSPLPHQLPDSHKRSFLGHKTRSEGGGEEGLTLRARYHLCQSAGCRHTAPPPNAGHSTEAAPGLRRLSQPVPSRIPWPPKVIQRRKEDL